MTAKEKALELVERFDEYADFPIGCALVAVKNEYHSLRELLFDLQSNRAEIPERVYLYRIQRLIDEEQELIAEINKL